MKQSRQNVSAIVVSVVMHVVALLVMALVQISLADTPIILMIETVMLDEDRDLQEVVQELDEEMEVADKTNFIAGGVVSTELGGSENPLSQQKKLEFEDVVKEPDIEVNVGIQDIQAVNTLGDDLGEEEVTGETGAIVEGYGAALDLITKELLRLLRNDRLHVVWVFDESESMKDDQEDLKKRIGRVYEELKLVDKDPAAQVKGKRKSSKLSDVLLTSIVSFGGSFHPQTPKPTSDVATLMKAIENIPVDKSGDEKLFQTLQVVLDRFKGTLRSGRRLVLIVVSDESGDDGPGNLEDVIHKAKSIRCPVYIIGRESVFGSLYAHVRWRQPETGYLYYLPIRRGPETPFAELLQFDGFRRRRDSHMSGFGPYDQVRLARDTGGMFLQLPHEQADLNDLDDRKFSFLDLKEYQPQLDSRRQYEEVRQRSQFRTAIWDVISLLNPHNPRNKGLEIPDYEYFPVVPAESNKRVANRTQQIMGVLAAMSVAQQKLESVKKFRDREPELRWRASYDLISAQLYAYRVRLFQYGLALDQFGKNMPKLIKKPKSNRWLIRTGARQMIMPDKQQEKLLRVTADDLKQAHKTALEQLSLVAANHPRTPWSRRAEWELSRNFGASFSEHYHAPPKPNAKPRPKPTPPPKL